MKIKSILFFICIVVCFSCKDVKNGDNVTNCKSENEKKDLKSNALINIEAGKYNRNNPILYSEIFKAVDVVPLETSDSFLIAGISSMRYVDEKIFIWDDKQSTIFIYDRSGKALCKINDRGDGPDQYLNIRGFDVSDKEKRIYVYTYPFYLFKYTFDGKLDEKIKETIDCSNFAIEGQHSLMYSGNRMNYVNGKAQNYQLWVKDLVNKDIMGYEPFDPKKTGSMRRVYNQNRNFFHFKNEVLFFELISNNILSIQDGKVVTKYHLDFGEQNIPEDYFDRFSNPDKAYEELERSNYIFKFGGCWENEKYFCIGCGFNDYGCTLLYDKLKKETRFSFFKDDLTACDPLMADATDEYLVAYFDMYYLLDLVDYVFQKDKVNLAESNEYLKKLLSKVDQDSNPVVFFYSFK